MAETLKLNVRPTPAAPPRYGLLNSANRPGMPDEHWGMGITWVQETCGLEVEAFDPQCGTPTLISNDDIASGEFTPYGIYGTFLCTTAEINNPDIDLTERANRAIDIAASFQLEQELWSGALARDNTKTQFGNEYLAESGAVSKPAGDTAQGLFTGLSLMEQALATCSLNSNTMIHMTPRTAAMLETTGAYGYLQREGNLWKTGLGTIVVIGAGYDGSSPATPGVPSGVTHATDWIYGTTMVDVRMSPTIILQAGPPLLTDNNLRRVTAWRYASASFDPDCCRVAINIDNTART